MISELSQLKNLDCIKKHITSIAVEASHKNVHKSIELDIELPVHTIEFKPNINIDLIIPRLTFARRHSKEDVLRQLNAIFNKLIGQHLTETQVHLEGYLSEVEKQMITLMTEAKKTVKRKMLEKINIIIDHLKDEALANIIPNIEDHLKEIANLECLKDDLQKIHICTYE